MSRSSRGPRPSLTGCLTLVCCVTAIAAYPAPHSTSESTVDGLRELPQRRSYAREAFQHPLHSATLENMGLLSQPGGIHSAPAAHSQQETIQSLETQSKHLRSDLYTAVSDKRSRKHKRRGAGVRLQSRRRLQQEGELHSRGKGDNLWREDPKLVAEQRDEDILAAAASKSDKVR